MNETQLRELLADRAAAVPGDPDRYAGVRRRITNRRRARVAGGAAALLMLVGVPAVVPRLDGPGGVTVAAGLGWPARGDRAAEPGVLDAAVAAWGGDRDGAALLYAGPSENRLSGVVTNWVVFEARESGAPIVVLVRAERDGHVVAATARPPSGSRSVGFAGTYAESPRDGAVVVLLAPGIERAALAGSELLESSDSGLVTVSFVGVDPPALRLDLYESSLVATEAPAATFTLTDPLPRNPEPLRGADPRAFGWEPRIQGRRAGVDCHTAVFCGQLDENWFGALHARPLPGDESVGYFEIHGKGSSRTAVDVPADTDVVAVTVSGQLRRLQLFLIGAPGVDKFTVVAGRETFDVAAPNGWAWLPSPRGPGTVTGYAGSRVVGTATFF